MKADYCGSLVLHHSSFKVLLNAIRLAVISIAAMALLTPLTAAEVKLVKTGSRLILGCTATNDLLRILLNNNVNLARFDTPAAAVEAAPQSAGVLILAA